MFLKSIFVIVTVMGALGEDYTTESDENLLQALVPLLNSLNGSLFDGPASISNAGTPTNKNNLPTLEQMMYYNYYAVSTYYAYDHQDLSCEYCLKFRDDVSKKEVLNNNTQNTLALVTLSEAREEIVVAFRGTWNIWNVVLDALLINGRDSSNIKIHQGFHVATMSLYDDVVKTVTCYLRDHPEFKVVITGHSLGGAMARLLYFFLVEKKQFPGVTYEVYTYGEPRVGNKYFADFMNEQTITTARVVNRGDIVAHVPPISILNTKLIADYYVHTQTEYWFDGEENQKFCSRTVYEDPKCSMSLGPRYSAKDHLTYFDTNLGSVIGQPLVFAYLPLGLLNPVEVLPPLPKPIENLIGGFGQGVLGATP